MLLDPWLSGFYHKLKHAIPSQRCQTIILYCQEAVTSGVTKMAVKLTYGEQTTLAFREKIDYTTRAHFGVKGKRKVTYLFSFHGLATDVTAILLCCHKEILLRFTYGRLVPRNGAFLST